MLTHDAVIWQYVELRGRAEIAADDVVLHALPLYHCAQLDVFLGPCDLRRRDQRHHRQADARQPAAADRASTASARSSRRRRCGSRCCARRCSTAPTCRALRKGYYGASIMPVEVLREIAAPAAGRAAAGTSTARPRSRRSPPCSGPKTSCASPARRARRAERRDARRRRRRCSDVTPGEVGEIVHRSPQLMLGYFHDDERTRGRVRGRLVPSRRPRRRIDDEGYITVVDRKKDMIKTGGENVASREVEEAIYRLPQVSRSGGDRRAASDAGSRR